MTFIAGQPVYCCATETIYIFKRYFSEGKAIVTYPPNSKWRFDTLVYLEDCVPITPLMKELL